MAFKLHTQLAEDSTLITRLALCQVRLMHQKAFPWILLIPERPNLVEITDLSNDDYLELCHEIRQATRLMHGLFHPRKMNIAMLGNQVSQLHVHLIARFEIDMAWPNPVWGTPLTPYSHAELNERLTLLTNAFQGQS